MGLVSALLGVLGFGIGIAMGLVVGYFFYVYFQPKDVKDPIVRPLHELDSKALHSLIPEILYWMKNPNCERVDWLYKFILDMWPCLHKAICNTIQSAVRPIFDQYTGKYWIKSIEFDHLTLGSLPPTIHGVKVYETQEKELVVQLAVRWAGNTNVALVIKLSFFKITIQLLDLQISLMPRVILKPLVPSFPCFANLSISLMEKPNVDFEFKIFGGDIMVVPGLYRFIQTATRLSALMPFGIYNHVNLIDTIATQVSDIYHWPNLLEIPILILDGSR
ncbi:synaptotagmin-3-like [Zingiber officinale]|uniref:synaptotagmin-3-like n=1 Tax=Zingiber officinale TaxID=94328 RepID=UPI001C4D1FFE|nr:synaptotagmin-3-like [Zingiber officinale]